ncbi:hypothetical protein ACS0TY_011583 [Phlomoides rotata]
MSSCSSFSNAGDSSRFCECGQPARVRISWTVNNPGRRFYGCKFWKVDGGGCRYFSWLDDPFDGRPKDVILYLLKEKREWQFKMEKESKSGNVYKNALIGSWVFFLAVWLIKAL